MLLSKKNNFIFIHVPKVAGQSVTNALMPHAATAWQRSLSPIIPYRFQLKLFTKLRTHTRISFPPQPYRDHIKAAEIADAMGLDQFKDYFSFAFVRNPWSWLLSRYTYALKNPRHTRHRFLQKFDDFSAFVRWHCDEDDKFYLQKSYVCTETGDRLVDFIGKQESLSEDFAHVCEKIGITSSLPTFNVSNNCAYTEHYNDETRDLVSNRYAGDIHFFDYIFD